VVDPQAPKGNEVTTSLDANANTAVMT